MKKAIVMQALILIAAYFVMTPDQLIDNTHVFGLIGSHEIVRGNTHWVMLGAAILSALNIWFWWPKEVKKNVTSNEARIVAEDTKSEAKAADPVVPKMD